MQQILLTQGKIAILDDDDFERLSGFKWFFRGERDTDRGYAVRHGKKTDPTKTVYLHREILRPPLGHEVIFLNHDGLDCRKANLRAVTKSQSRHHHRVRADCEAGHKGVIYTKAGTWSADIFTSAGMMRLGTFDKEEFAVQAYEQAMRRYYPELCDAPEIVDRDALVTSEEEQDHSRSGEDSELHSSSARVDQRPAKDAEQVCAGSKV